MSCWQKKKTWKRTNRWFETNETFTQQLLEWYIFEALRSSMFRDFLLKVNASPCIGLLRHEFSVRCQREARSNWRSELASSALNTRSVALRALIEEPGCRQPHEPMANSIGSSTRTQWLVDGSTMNQHWAATSVSNRVSSLLLRVSLRNVDCWVSKREDAKAIVRTRSIVSNIE